MNWYRKSVTAEKVQPKDKKLGWCFVDVTKEVMDVHSSVQDEIKEKDLYIEKGENEDEWSYGLEDTPHITLKFGFDFDDPQPITDSLKGEKGGKVEVSGVEIFEGDENDVLVARVKSEALDRLHKKLTDDLQIKDTHPEYKPHITIAYFKKGMAKKYESMALKAFTYYLLKFNFDEVTFEDSNNKQTKINLV